MESVLVAAGGLVLASLVIGLGTLGWRGTRVYRKIEGFAASAILPATGFLIGLVLGTQLDAPPNIYASIGLMALPGFIWLSLYLWRTIAAELQRDEPPSEPHETIVEDRRTNRQRQNLDNDPH